MRHIDTAAADLQWKDRLEVTLAGLFHDSVYIPGRTDNELQSANLATEVIPAYFPSIDLERIKHLILLTAKHGTLTRAQLDGDPDAMLFLDCDMAILGASPKDFDAYDAAIGEEYRDVVPAIIFRFNRRRFLKRLLELDRLYLSDYFHARLDAQARANLRRVLAH